MDYWAAGLITVPCLLVGGAITYLAYKFLEFRSQILLVTLFVLPSLIVMLFAGRITEFKIPWIMEATLPSAAIVPVLADASAKAEAEISVNQSERLADTVSILAGDAPDADLQQMAFWAQAAHIVIVRASQWKDLDGEKRLDRAMPLATVMYNSLLAGAFQALVVLDDGNRPLGVFERSYFLELLRIPMDVSALPPQYSQARPTREVIRAQVRESRLWPLISSPELRAEREGSKAWISQRASRIEALRLMVDNRYSVMVLTDDSGRYAGIITLEDLSAKLLVELVSGE